MMRPLLTLLFILAGAATAAANDWYVDPINGNDANSGTWAWDAWRTLVWADYHVPEGAAETIHLAPGTYVEANTFFMRPHWRVVGDGGSAVTILDHSGVTDAVLFLSISSGYPYNFEPDTELRGLTIRAPSANAIEIGSSFLELSPTLVDVVVSNAKTGIWYNHSTSASGTWTPTFDGVRISNCDIGILINAFSPGVTTTPRMLDCEVRSCSHFGMYVGGRLVAFDAERCQFVSDGSAGLFMQAAGLSLGGVFEDCLFAKSGRGVRGVPDFNPPPSSIDLTLRRCTVADNDQVGIDVLSTAILATQIRLESTIVARNADDLLLDPSASVSHCCIEDGDFAGANGNFAADPAFVDAAGGDYRLRWASACAETGDPATPAGSVDLAGHLRPIDGDLDTVEAPDVGAFELAPLELTTNGHSGSIATFEFWGEQNTSSLLYFTRSAPVAPIMTTFGELDLDPASARKVLRTAVGAGPPSSIQRMIPSSPAWIGHTLAFQALTRSSIAPNGAAYTNAVHFTIVP